MGLFQTGIGAKISSNRGAYYFMRVFAVLVAVFAVVLFIFKNIPTAKSSSDTESTSSSSSGRVNFSGNIVALSEAKAGDTVCFGSYEQDNDFGDGKEAIEWLVLDKQDGKLLLLSKDALDCKKYNEEWEVVTWEMCTLRSWLNGKFYNTAFSQTEQGLILTTKVKNEDNPKYGTEGGKDTKDKVFLLSIGEVLNYFDSDPNAADPARKVKVTEYAKAQRGVAGGKAWWWLRSPGFYDSYAAYVNYDGYLYLSGDFVDDEDGGVRPALWLDVETLTPTPVLAQTPVPTPTPTGTPSLSLSLAPTGTPPPTVTSGPAATPVAEAKENTAGEQVGWGKATHPNASSMVLKILPKNGSGSVKVKGSTSRAVAVTSETYLKLYALYVDNDGKLYRHVGVTYRDNEYYGYVLAERIIECEAPTPTLTPTPTPSPLPTPTPTPTLPEGYLYDNGLSGFEGSIGVIPPWLYDGGDTSYIIDVPVPGERDYIDETLPDDDFSQIDILY